MKLLQGRIRGLSTFVVMVFTLGGIGLVGVQPASAAAAVSAPSASQIGALNNFVNICTNSCDVSGYNSETLKTEITLVTAGSAYLKLGTTSGISQAPSGYTTAEWTSGTATQIGFLGNQATTNSILEGLLYSSRTSGTSREVKITTSVYTANDAFDATTGHFYEVVNYGGSIGWRDARCQAKWGTDSFYNGSGLSSPSDDQCTNKSDGLRRTKYGLNGYLTNITSLDEHQFLQTYMTNGTVGWIGGSDHVGTTADGIWRWFDGPETNQVFYVQTQRGEYQTLSTRRTTNLIDSRNMFNYFSEGEPNGDGGGEDYAEFGFGSDGVGDSWNDCGANCTRTFYIVEYGGDGGTLAGLATNNVTVVTPIAAAATSSSAPTAVAALVPGTVLSSAVTFSGYPAPVKAITWQRSANGTSDWQTIAAQTAATYTLTAADVGFFIRTNETGSVYINNAVNSSAVALSSASAVVGLAAPIAAPDLAMTSDSGSSTTDNRTNVVRPTVNLTGLSVGATATITATKASTTSVLCTSAAAPSDGTASCAFASSLEDGVWQLSVTQNLNGQTSVASAALSITVDTEAPGLTLSAPPTPNKNPVLVYTLSSLEALQAAPTTTDFTITGDSSCSVSSVTGAGPYSVSVINCGAPKSIALSLKHSVVSDLAGNLNDAVAASTVSTDRSAPTVTAVGFTTPNATFGVGKEINLVVDMSEDVVLDGSPRIALNSATGRYASYVSNLGDKIYFKYVVQAGDQAADLDYESTTAFLLNGATILDAALNTSDLTLAEPGSADSLAAAGSMIVDTTPASLTLSAITTGVSEQTTVRFRVTADSRNLNCSSISLVSGVDFTFTNITSIIVTPSVALNRCEIEALVSFTPGQQGVASLTPVAGLAITDTLGNTAGQANVSYLAAAVDVSVPALPTVLAANLASNGKILTVEFSRALSTAGPNKTAFTLLVNGEVFEINDVISISATNIVLTTKRTIFISDLVKLTYIDPTSGDDSNSLQDAINGADVESFTNQVITNLSTKTAAVAPANTLTLTVTEGESLTLTAPVGRTFSSVYFASYGTPNDDFTLGSCHATTSTQKVGEAFIGQNTATISASNQVFGDTCPNVSKRLRVTLLYSSAAMAPIAPSPTPAANLPTGLGSVVSGQIAGEVPRSTPIVALDRIFGAVSQAAQSALANAKIYLPVSTASGEKVSTDFSGAGLADQVSVSESISIVAGQKLNFEIQVDSVTASDHVTAGYLKKTGSTEWIYLGQLPFDQNWARSEALAFTEPGVYLAKIIVVPDGATNLKVARLGSPSLQFDVQAGPQILTPPRSISLRRATISDTDVAVGLRSLEVEITVTAAVFPDPVSTQPTPTPSVTPISTPSPTPSNSTRPKPQASPKPSTSGQGTSGAINENSAGADSDSDSPDGGSNSSTSGAEGDELLNGDEQQDGEMSTSESANADATQTSDNSISWWPVLIGLLILGLLGAIVWRRKKREPTRLQQ